MTNIKLGVAIKTLPQNGNLVYEYNPFRNYRLTEDMYSYQNHLYTLQELNDMNLANGTSITGEGITYYKKGELVDFETDKLSFNLNNPVSIIPQYSYDGSVNLILNDGKNIPRLINSRFSSRAKNTYEIVDRSGDEDTNIYDSGEKFDIDTSLYKRIVNIPKLTFNGVISGGSMKIGNYNFYFKYADSDGNETDFVAESSVVSVYIGNSSTNCTTGVRNENSNKSISFILTNIDKGYQYVRVYYTRNSSDILQDSYVESCKILKDFIINNDNTCKITITGFENIEEVSLAEINTQYNIMSSAQTQTIAQNRLFLGNVTKSNIPYSTLEQCSLRFLPFLNSENYDISINQNYNISSFNKGYYDPKFIYNKVGYWDNELYRIGIVYIMKDNSLSPVFNIRGHLNLSTYDPTDTTTYTSYPINKDIEIDETTYKLDKDSNTRGVISLNNSAGNFSISSLDIRIDDQVNVLNKLKTIVKGYFFVRQKRIPTILCQAITMGIDRKSHTPLIPVGKYGLLDRINYTKTPNDSMYYVAERFLDDDKELIQDFQKRVFVQKPSDVNQYCAICPEYDVNPEYYNSIFNGEDFQIEESKIQPENTYFDTISSADIDQHFYINKYVKQSTISAITAKIIGVEDGVELNGINSTYFSTKAGSESEAVRFSYLNSEIKTKSATNLIRGQFGPILGIVGYNKPCRIINIRISGYSDSNIDNYLQVRYNDKTTYQAISERIDINDLSDYTDTSSTVSFKLYRGDCYICQFTHRVNRNFQDPSAPTNDIIVDKDCWKNNYDPDASENFEKINLGDLNAIQMGTWVTFMFKSTYNLNIRTLDGSNVDETLITGHSRGFYPYLDMNTSGNFKTQEALCYNKGFSKSLSERWNFEMPNVPYIKNNYENRICYSNININDAFRNGFRVFELSNYKDFPKTYGSIIKLVETQGNLLCVFEHGICLIPVNERAVAASGSGGQVFINTNNVLPDNPRIISDKYGSQWSESIIKTPYYIYGLDAVARKIWRTDGERIEIISDFKVQKFLNDNITLTERELTPIIGIRNIKTHYNAFKNDVMFTFYDNLSGFNEKAWSLCYNEILQKFTTFYSWIPSYSDNIYNEYFSFNRDVSKWIAKLGVSKAGNDFSNGIVLDNNIIDYYETNITNKDFVLINNEMQLYDSSIITEQPNTIYTKVTKLDTKDITIPTGDKISIKKSYSLAKDIYKNYKNFYIFDNTLYLKRVKETYNADTIYSPTYQDLISEFYIRTDGTNSLSWEAAYIRNNDVYLSYDTYKNKEGLKEYCSTYKNENKIVQLLNIKVTFTITLAEGASTEVQNYVSNYNHQYSINAGQYEYTVALLPKFNEQFLVSDFWKHGQSGIIDIKDIIKPCYWYGKQHPFEFEVIVADNPGSHKIFDNLEIVSNAAQPESFHYEIVGECFDFASDKANMFVRQEVTKDFYQSLGSDITYNTIWNKINTKHEMLSTKDSYKKSTTFPLYYARQDKINSIEDSYKEFSSPNKDYSNLSGAEIIYDGNTFKIWNHCKAVEIADSGRLRGNMNYQEDTWDVMINPIIIVQKNESSWGNNNTLVPITIGNQPVPNDITAFQITQDEMPEDLKDAGYTLNDIDSSNWGVYPVYSKNGSGQYEISGYENSNTRKEIKVKDKFVRIRIRYSGSDLAIISALKTFYSISYA